MMRRTLILGTAMLFAAVSMTGCGDSDSKGKGEATGQGGGHEHKDGDSHSGGGHMQHMVDVKKWLKGELKDQYDQPVPAVTKEQLASGKEIYARICSACHGTSGKGDGPASVAFKKKPADFTDAAHSKYYSDRGRIHIIKKGINDTPMVGLESTLSEEEIQSVYGYVVSLRASEGNGEHGHDDDHDEQGKKDDHDEHGKKDDHDDDH